MKGTAMGQFNWLLTVVFMIVGVTFLLAGWRKQGNQKERNALLASGALMFMVGMLLTVMYLL
ncbi:hypothetical protein JK159_05005 [Weissella minor]|nr:hypothetical protein [Weissella minor]